MDENDLSPLARWSLRKQRVRSGEDVDDEPQAESSAEPVRESAVDEAKPALTDADMPPVESLHAESDLSMFFSPGVSEALRKRALRHFFSLPGAHVVDRMNEYDDDYTSYVSLGDLIPDEMQRKLDHEARKLAERASEQTTAEHAETEIAEVGAFEPSDQTPQDGPSSHATPVMDEPENPEETS
jgi:hypothetical protein